MITQKRLKELLRYAPKTGIWTWRATRGPCRRGDRAGTIRCGSKHNTPYLYIFVESERYTASRLAWFYMTGSWPTAEIGHKDRNSLNDAWKNLRDVSRYVNESNKGAYRNNATGHKGVVLQRGRFRASIQRHWKRHQLGSFSSLERGVGRV